MTSIVDDQEILNILAEAIDQGVTYRELNEAFYQYMRDLTYSRYPGFDPKVFEAMLLVQKNFVELLSKDMGLGLDSPIKLSENVQYSEITQKYSALIGKAFSQAVKQLNQV